MKLIKDPIHGNIELSLFEHILLRNELLNRLHNIIQTSLAYLVFPSAKHSRFSHSIGVMHLSGKIFKYALINSDKSTLENYLETRFRRIEEYINKFYQKRINEVPTETRHSLSQRDRKSDRYRVALEIFIKYFLGEKFLNSYNIHLKEEKYIFTYFLLLQVTRLKGLLHDVGHLPFSHIFEFALSNLIERDDTLQEILKKKGYLKEIKNEEKENNEKQFVLKDKLHELLGKELIPPIISFGIEHVKKSYSQIHPEHIFYIGIIGDLLQTLVESNEFKEIKDVVSSDLDADRMDFVLRDGTFSGLIYSTGDHERVIKTFKLLRHDDNNDESFHIYPSIQALNDIQEILVDRFRIYKFLVNHHKVKKMDAILQRLIEKELEKVNITAAGDEKPTIDEIGDSIKVLTNENLTFLYHQLTDELLLVLLKKVYYSKLESLDDNGEEKFLLKELFTFSNELFSFWKRDNEYKSLILDVLSKREDLQQKIKDMSVLQNIDIFEAFQAATHSIEWGNIDKVKAELRQENIICEEEVVLVIPSSLRKIGVSKDFKLSDLKSDNLFKIEEVSPLINQLDLQFKQSIRFFIFSNINRNYEKKKEFLERFLEKIFLSEE